LNALNAFIGLFIDRPPNIFLIKAHFYFHITPTNSLYRCSLKCRSYALLFRCRFRRITRSRSCPCRSGPT
jgi:hypothetical protein